MLYNIIYAITVLLYITQVVNLNGVWLTVLCAGGEGDLVSFSCQWVEDKFEEMERLLSAQGWITSRVLLRTQEWRYNWTVSAFK